MKEIIQVNLGQGGVRIGEEVWNQLIREYQLDPEGPLPIQTDLSTFLHESGKYYKPRTVFFDFDKALIWKLKSGKMRNFFDQELTIYAPGENDGTYACSYYDGKKAIEQVLDVIRLQLEKCESPDSIMINHCLGGGTGSGFGSLLFESLAPLIGKLPLLTNTIYPNYEKKIGASQTSSIEPYNSILATHSMTEFTHATAVFTNEGVAKLLSKNYNCESPGLFEINQVIANHIVHQLSFPLCQGKYSQHASYGSTLNSICPYPRLHFLSTAISPFKFEESEDWHPGMTMLREVFRNKQYLLNLLVNEREKISGSLLLMRQCAYSEILSQHCLEKQFHQLLKENQKNVQRILIHDFTNSAVNLKILPETPYNLRQKVRRGNSLLALHNNWSISYLFCKIDLQFDLQYARRAFVHHFTGWGLPEGIFSEAREDVAALEKDFEYWSFLDDAFGEEEQE